MKKTKGIILAGGYGTRLYPLTQLYSKQLVAVYDKPMIYYPLTTMVSTGIKDILIIADSRSLAAYKDLFIDANLVGLNISYAEQSKPNGIAEAFIIGENFIGKDNVALILGDNLFYGADKYFYDVVQSENLQNTIFALRVAHPEQYGVIQFAENYERNGINPLKIIEKPKTFVSNYAVPGFYVYDKDVVKIAKKLKPSARGELEITDVNNILFENKKLSVKLLDNGATWLDCGTPDSLLQASSFIASVEARHGLKIGCYEEAAYLMNFVSHEKLMTYANKLPQSTYKEYLLNIMH